MNSLLRLVALGVPLVLFGFGVRQATGQPAESPRGLQVDEFPLALTQVTLASPNGVDEEVVLAGPIQIEVETGSKGEAVDLDGDGLDEVRARITKLEMRGRGARGPILIRLRDEPVSAGAIEETANTTRGVLDLPPFAASGRADSFFDIWVDLVIGDQVLRPAQPIRLSTIVTRWPPTPDEKYQSIDERPNALLDPKGNPTGLLIRRVIHVPNPEREVDQFPASVAQITLQLPTGVTELVELTGPTVVEVAIPPSGMAADTDGDGRDQVSARMTQLQLSGNSSLGLVRVGLNPDQPSRGEIEEVANESPGILDVPPFTRAGTADSFFEVYFEITVNDQSFRAAGPARMQSLIRHKPPAPGDEYVNPFVEPIDLLDANGKATGIRLVREVHVPSPGDPRSTCFESPLPSSMFSCRMELFTPSLSKDRRPSMFFSREKRARRTTAMATVWTRWRRRWCNWN
jgi:hypothetical protein